MPSFRRDVVVAGASAGGAEALRAFVGSLPGDVPAAELLAPAGTLDDGAPALRSIVDRGGLAVVQDPADALHPGMPEIAPETAP